MRKRKAEGINERPDSSVSFVGCNLKDAIDKPTDKWMGWTIGCMTAKETGIPRNLPYLTGFVVQATIDEEITV